MIDPKDAWNSHRNDNSPEYKKVTDKSGHWKQWQVTAYNTDCCLGGIDKILSSNRHADDCVVV
jgi:hypothetical protein